MNQRQPPPVPVEGRQSPLLRQSGYYHEPISEANTCEWSSWRHIRCCTTQFSEWFMSEEKENDEVLYMGWNSDNVYIAELVSKVYCPKIIISSSIPEKN